VRVLGSLCVIGVVLFALLIFGAQVLGEALPLPEAIRGLHLTDCPLPCWSGISVGETPLHEASERIRALYQETKPKVVGSTLAAVYEAGASSGTVEVFADENAIVRQITMYVTDVKDLALGDIISLMGTPTFIYGRPPTAIVYICATGLITVAGSSPETGWRGSLAMIKITRVRSTYSCALDTE
jgi:hypothetical protein